MEKVDLSILIPARNEIYLAKTIENLLENLTGNTEILVGLDGEWSNPPIPDDSRVTILYMGKSIGQRAITNKLCKLSRAKWVMKIDAHCAIDKGMDQKMLDFVGDNENWTAIPAMYNLHGFNWKCKKCGNEWYQSPTPSACHNPGEGKGLNKNCDGKEFEKVMIWQKRGSRRSECYRFDTTLHFQYHREWMRKHHANPIETMSAQGSCFMLTRKKYWDLNICDEDFGSWGQQGTEVACKTWLSGGRLVTNKNTWYAHLFRTQGGDFGFPYQLSGNQVEHARKYSKELFMNNKWDKQARPLSWLIDKFKPLPDWHSKKHEKIYNEVKEKGKLFTDYKLSQGLEVMMDNIKTYNREKKTNQKGIIFYTDNKLKLSIAHRVQSNLKSMGLPITSASLKPMDMGRNYIVKGERGVLTMFRQILTALENAQEEIIFFCEHDVLYHPSHFEFTPKKKDVFYYNENVWKLGLDGKALHYDCKQVSGICVYRETALKHYRKRVEIVQSNGYSNRMGYEPGTHSRAERVDDFTSEGWKSTYPNIDIRHGENLSPTRWSKDQFRNQKYTKGWIESDTIPGWGTIENIGVK